MDKVRSTLSRVRDSFQPPPAGFDRLGVRRERRERIRRGAAAVMAMTLTAGLAFGLWSVMRQDLRSRPRPGGTVSVNVGGSPVDIAIGEGGIWVATKTDLSGRGEVVRIDPNSGEVVARIPVSEVGALAAEEGNVWVANLSRATVTRIDPETNAVADVIAMPPSLKLEGGQSILVTAGRGRGFGQVWVETRRRSAGPTDLSAAEVLGETGVPSVILGGMTPDAGPVAWNIFEPPDAELWRIYPMMGGGFSANVLRAAQGSAGLFVLHPESGAVSLVGAVDRFTGPVNRDVPIARVGERANAITMAWPDPILYVAGASGKIYRIDLRKGSPLDATAPLVKPGLVTHLDAEPLAFAHGYDALWVAGADGVVTKVAVDPDSVYPEIAPQPQIAPSPTPKEERGGDEQPPGRIEGAFYPRTYREGDDVIMPITVVDGTKAELVIDERLQPEDLGVIGFTVGGLGSIDRDISLRHGPEPIYEMHSGPIETYEGVGGTRVEVWNPPPDEGDCPSLVFRFGEWFATTRTCSPDLSEADKRAWAQSLVGQETEDGFLVLEARRPLVLHKSGGQGPELLLETLGDGPWIIVRPAGSCKTDEPAEDQEVRVTPDGLKVNFGSYDGTWYADWCEDGGMYVSVEAPDKEYVEIAMNGGLRVRNISLAE